VRADTNLRRRRSGYRGKQAAAMAVMAAFALAMLIPLYWVLISSMRTPEEIFSTRQTLVPNTFSLHNFRELLEHTLFVRSVINSLIVATIVTVLGTVFSLAAGFAFAKLEFVGKRLIFMLLLTSMTIPGAVTLLPTFILMSRIGLIDTLYSVILPSLALPFAMLWMRQYIQAGVPDTVLDAARIDGCGEIKMVWKVVGPIVRPGLAGVGIWIFLSQWNSFFLPLVFLNSEDKFTFPVFLATLQGNPLVPNTHLVIAASALSLAPIIIMFVAFQRHFVASAAMSIDQG
jgi:ABC-type glycerol-3-phosphate transport system permease component